MTISNLKLVIIIANIISNSETVIQSFGVPIEINNVKTRAQLFKAD